MMRTEMGIVQIGQGGFQPRLAVQLLKSWPLKAALER